jgi:hypothetical protein
MLREVLRQLAVLYLAPLVRQASSAIAFTFGLLEGLSPRDPSPPVRAFVAVAVNYLLWCCDLVSETLRERFTPLAIHLLADHSDGGGRVS